MRLRNLAVVPALLLGGAAASPVALADTTTPSVAPGAQPVEFGTALGDAPVLSPGRIATTAPTGNTTTYASIKRPAGGSVSVAVFGDVDATITTADGKTSCSSTDSGSFDAVGKYDFLFLDGADTKRQSYLADGCAEATDLRLTLKAPSSSSSSSSSSAPPNRNLQLVLTVEPKVLKLEPPTTKSGFGTLTVPSKETTGQDRVLSDQLLAPDTLTPNSYPVTLRPGKLAVARVRVGWGQRLAVSVDAPRNGTNIAPPESLGVALALFSPQWSRVNGSGATMVLSAKSSDEQTLDTYTAPVNAANRQVDYGTDTGDLGSGSVQWTTTAGWYTIAIYTDGLDKAGPTPTNSVPARVNIAVVGAATAGPTYADAAGAAVTAPPADQLSVGGADSGGGGSVLPKIGLSALIVAAAAGAVVALRRLT